MLPLFVKKFLIRTGLARILPITDRLSYGATDFVPYYSDRVLAAPIDDLLDAAAFPDAVGPDVMNLNLAVPRYDSPLTGGRVVADRQGLPSPSGLLTLRLAVGEQYRAPLGRLIDPREEVLITHGATGALAAALDAFVNPGDAVVSLDPCSPLFRLGAKSRRAKFRTVPSRVEEGQLKIDLPTLTRQLRGAMMLVLANPCNPTGAMLSPETWEQIVWAATRADVLIYLDQSFARFQYQPMTRLGFQSVENRLILAGSISQAEGLASSRVGWAVAHKHLIRPMKLMANLSAPYVPTLCQQVALRCLHADEELFGPVLEEFRGRKQYAADKLRAMGFRVSEPAGGYFFWLDVRELGRTGRAFAEELFREQRVLVGPGDVFGASGAAFIRLSFAEEDGRLREGLSRLGQFVAQLRGETAAEPDSVEDTAPADDVESGPPAFSRV